MDNYKEAVFSNYMANRTGVTDGKEIQQSGGTNLLINYLPSDMQENELHQLFNSFGLLRQVKIIRDPETGASHCYGFVNYTNSISANKALNSMNGCPVRGKKLKVSMARPSSDDTKKTNIYVGNLPLSYDAAQVREIFERFGKIVDLNLLKDRYTNQSRGTAFVRYEMRASVEKAILALNDFVVERGHPPLHVRLVKRPKEWAVSKGMNREPDEPSEPSTDTHVDSPKEEIKQSMDSKCFFSGDMDKSTADSTAASSSKPMSSLSYKYLTNINSNKGRRFVVPPPTCTPASPATNESVGLAGGTDKASEKAANCSSPSLDTGLTGKESDIANIINRSALRRKIPYKRFATIPKPGDT
ncbi:sex-lethal homolog isoform X2 [Drosophila mojavensis]|uniref:Uncharacterized protein, isoform A n=2 Tax=Drosophila mojavensis TaxID=7230 RepID=B4KB66_DROMO|nr:sex-lethal homolog isoform X2 [Drosophila mojavensis]EDW15770.1 uncharacterized protein Dmoj_GI10157, isoform A [Drosophila mojavensis]KRG01730.1 uncharacterized protein Dmoj_GI10157, isoform B [Drosophila mojavensis]